VGTKNTKKKWVPPSVSAEKFAGQRKKQDRFLLPYFISIMHENPGEPQSLLSAADTHGFRPLSSTLASAYLRFANYVYSLLVSYLYSSCSMVKVWL